MNPFTQIFSQNNQSGDNPFSQIFTPSDVASAEENLGSQVDNGECQAFAEQNVYGKTGIFPTASSAADYYSQNGELKSDFQNMKPGDLIYFKDPNQPNGHVGIYKGNDSMISATYNGVQEDDIKNWLQSTSQSPLGYVRIGGNQ